MKRKAKVIKAKDSFLWYAHKVGQVIEIERETYDFYWAREDAGYINIVHKEDIEFINERGNDESEN